MLLFDDNGIRLSINCFVLLVIVVDNLLGFIFINGGKVGVFSYVMVRISMFDLVDVKNY